MVLCQRDDEPQQCEVALQAELIAVGIKGDIRFLLQPEEKCIAAVEKVTYCHRHTPRSTSHNFTVGVIENLHMQGVLLPRAQECTSGSCL